MSIKNKNIWQQDNRGFTILEVAVSLFVISMGILGVMALVNQSIKVKDVNKNKIIASQLAQEGVEIVRSTRDNNWLDKKDWEDDIIHDGSYIVNPGSGVIDASPDSLAASTTKLYLDSEGYYKHDLGGSATSTPFRRIIKVASSTEETDASTTVESVVQWKDRGNTYEYTAETILYNWRYP